MQATRAPSKKKHSRVPRAHHAPTVQQILSSDLTQLSLEHWAGDARTTGPSAYDAKLVERIYTQHMCAHGFDSQAVVLLELSRYLERYLWPHFLQCAAAAASVPSSSACSSPVSRAHLMSIVVMINEKFRQKVPAWECFRAEPDRFGVLFQQILLLAFPSTSSSSSSSSEHGASATDGAVSWAFSSGVVFEGFSWEERAAFVLFLVNCFQSFEETLVRPHCLQLVGLRTWHHLPPSALQRECVQMPKLAALWNRVCEQEQEANEVQPEEEGDAKVGKRARTTKKKRKKTKKSKKPPTISYPLQSHFVVSLCNEFLRTVYSSSLDEDPLVATAEDDEKLVTDYKMVFLERFLELLTDLIAQLPTRRFFRRVLMYGVHMSVLCRLSPLMRAFDQLHIEDQLKSKWCLFSKLLERFCFYERFEIDDFTGEALSELRMTELHCDRLRFLQRICYQHMGDDLRDLSLSHLGGIQTREGLVPHLRHLSVAQLGQLCELLCLGVPQRPRPQQVSGQETNAGTEAMQEQGDEDLEDLDHLDGKDVFQRHLLIELLVTHHEVRSSQLDQLNSSPLYPNELVLWDKETTLLEFHSRQSAIPLPKLNLQFLTTHDYLLRQYELYRLESAHQIRDDLEQAVRRMQPRQHPDNSYSFCGHARMALQPNAVRIKYVAPPPVGYHHPAKVSAVIDLDLRKLTPKVRGEWLSLRRHDVLFLLSVHASIPSSVVRHQDSGELFRKTFGVRYVRGCELMSMTDELGNDLNDPRLTDEQREHVLRSPVRQLHVLLDPAQYQLDVERHPDRRHEEAGRSVVYNAINLVVRRDQKENNFRSLLSTTRQLMNSTSSLPGWLQDVLLGYGDPSLANLGEPHTLDFADTFLSEEHLRQSFPNAAMIDFEEENAEQRVPPFIVQENVLAIEGKRKRSSSTKKTPSSVELTVRCGNRSYPHANQLPFTPTQVHAIKKGMQRGLTVIQGPPGSGKTDVAAQLIKNLFYAHPTQRILLLTHSNDGLNQLFDKLVALQLDESVLVRLGHGAQRLATVKDFSLQGRIDHLLYCRMQLLARAAELLDAEEVPTSCEAACHLLATCQAPDAVEVAAELAELRALELLRTARERFSWLVTKRARLVALTCTHAAMRAPELLEMGFQYDSVVIEEAAQVLEVEAFVPLVLQRDPCRLQRLVLIGDHCQLPPVVQHQVLERCGLGQSMFQRLVRLGVDAVVLDAQGRSRPSLASLFSWRYRGLRDLPAVCRAPFTLANAGFLHTAQLVDVDGEESTPTPHFYVNLNEAEYVVACYQYMRLLGYPAHSIALLTTYEGQRELLEDIVQARCASNPLFGTPRISTVDSFQGQQADHILLSLVRTRTVGHLRDVRRLVVAVSRARVGLYVFCRRQVFEQCYELSEVFSRLLARGVTKLHLVQNEAYPSERAQDQPPQDPTAIYPVIDANHLMHLVQQHTAFVFAKQAEQQMQ